MAILKNLVAVAGTYNVGGVAKKKYVTVGKLLDGPNGQFITLDPTINIGALQRSDDGLSVYVNLYDPNREERPAMVNSDKPPRKSRKSAKREDDDIPF